MEKIPLKLKLKLGSGGPSTPEQKKASPAHPTIISMAEEDPGQMSEEELEEEEGMDEGQGDDDQYGEEEGRKSKHSHHDEGTREKHKKSKKKKKKKEREKDKERHKHRHHRDKAEDDVGEEPPVKKQHVEDKDAAPGQAMRAGARASSAALTQLLDYMVKQLEKKDPQQVFAWPVTDAIAPGYSSIISQPMDFSTMKQKINDNQYSSIMQLESDFKLMCNNCMTYNQQDTIYYKAARRLLHMGVKMMAPDKLVGLKREVPLLTTLSKEQLGFDINPVAVSGGVEVEPAVEEVDQDESMDVDIDSREPQSKFEPVQDDLTSEEILEQVQTVANEAADRLASKKIKTALGFLRQRVDGTTTLNFVTGCEGDAAQKDKPVNLGLMTGKLTQGTATLTNHRDDKRNMAKPVKPLYYGSYSSFCPTYDSTFANLTKEESEMVYATYGNETAVQYAESICDFSQDCDMAMHLVDQLLNLLTHQQHSRTKGVIEDRRKLQEEEEKINSLLCTPSDGAAQSGNSEQKPNSVDFESLKTLSDIGIDTSFLKDFEDMQKKESAISTQLEENAGLLESLAKEQRDRLSKPLTQATASNLPSPTPKELNLVEKVTDGLAMVAKQVTPGSLAPAPIVRRASGMHTSASEHSEQIEVDIEGTSSQGESTPPPSAKSSGGPDLESQLRHILNQADASSPPPIMPGVPDMTDKKLKEILGN